MTAIVLYMQKLAAKIDTQYIISHLQQFWRREGKQWHPHPCCSWCSVESPPFQYRGWRRSVLHRYAWGLVFPPPANTKYNSPIICYQLMKSLTRHQMLLLCAYYYSSKVFLHTVYSLHEVNDVWYFNLRCINATCVNICKAIFLYKSTIYHG